jgi:uncharacterized membrane protein HdeD (DUF308 family)
MSIASGAASVRRGMSAPVSLLAGVAALIVGALLIFMPTQATVLVVFLLGAVVLIKGIATIVDASHHQDAPMWGWRVIAGMVGLVAGLLVLASPSVSAIITVVVAYYVLAVGLVIAGIMELASGLRQPHSWWAVALGALQIVLAVAIMFFPTTGAIVMLQLGGAFVMAMGLVLAASSFGRS